MTDEKRIYVHRLNERSERSSIVYQRMQRHKKRSRGQSLRGAGMKVLVVGGGGREHALVWKIAQSPKVAKIYAAPGNAGIALLAECAPVKAEDITGLVAFARSKAIDLTVVGPEGPLSKGIVNEFAKAGLRAF